MCTMFCRQSQGGTKQNESASDSSDSSDSDDDPRAQQRRQGRKLFKPTPASTTRLAGEHISVTLAPGMKQVIDFSEYPYA